MVTDHERKFNEFFTGYLVAALWSTNDNSDESGGQPLDLNHDVEDIDAETTAMLRAHCESFFYRAIAFLDSDMNDVRLPNDGETTVYALAGHDFWLTSNGHGAGFWDGDWPRYGDMFTKLSACYPEVNLFLSDTKRAICA